MSCIPKRIVTSGVIRRGLREDMRARTQTFKGCQPHSSPFGLLLVLAGASLLLTALAPRANAEVDANVSWTGAKNTIWSISD